MLFEETQFIIVSTHCRSNYRCSSKVKHLAKGGEGFENKRRFPTLGTNHKGSSDGIQEE